MLGLCCQYLEPKIARTGSTKYINIANEKSLQYNRFLKQEYSNKNIEDTWINNVINLSNLIQKISSEGFKLFRISSSLFPLYDSVPDLLKNSSIKNELNKLGKYIISQNMRVTTHPDQFVVLSSNNPQVIDNSIRMLEHHSWIFDQMDLYGNYYSINIHGGVKNNQSILIDSINKLSSSLKNRLTLENDERSYSVKQLYSIYESMGVSIVFDSHHHTFNDANLSIEDGLNLAKSTWKVKPLTHLSNTDPELAFGSFLEKRKHSDYVYYIPDCQKQDNDNDIIDIEMEFKMKNLAIKKAVIDFGIKL